MSDYTELVMVITGSVNDWSIMDHCCETLADLEVIHSKVVASAHRQPERLRQAVTQFLEQGGKIFICGAGMAAHLSGVVASMTTRPVIGVPLLQLCHAAPGNGPSGRCPGQTGVGINHSTYCPRTPVRGLYNGLPRQRHA
ncbi:MAG TPA: AIR carboxylase family protein [Myxococcales bacterium]|nr:AIR carboxylase family protein [Myxococcales bacterium]